MNRQPKILLNAYNSSYLPVMPVILRSSLALVPIAILVGLATAFLPPMLTAAGIGLIIGAILCYLDLRVMLLVMLTVAPLKALIETELPGTISLPLDIGQAAFVMYIAIYLIRAITLRRDLDLPPIRVLRPVLVPLCAFTLMAALSLFNTQSSAHTLKELAIWVGIAVTMILTVGTARRFGLAGTAAVVIAAACIHALIGVYEFFGGSGAAHLWILDYRYFRAFGSFGQPNPFGAYMGLSLPLAVGVGYGLIVLILSRPPTLNPSLARAGGTLMRTERATPLPSPPGFPENAKHFEGGLAGEGVGGWGVSAKSSKSSDFIQADSPRRNDDSVTLDSPRMLYLLYLPAYLLLGAAVISIGILGAGLISSWSRGAWLGVGIALTGMLVLLPRRLGVGIGLATGAVAAIGIAVVTGLAPASLVARFSDFAGDLAGFGDVRGAVISDANYAVLERFAHWQAALGMAQDNPLTGVGFGAYEVAYPQYALMNWKNALGHAHNFYLNVLAETGIIGAVTYVAMWVCIVAWAIRGVRMTRGWRRGLAIGCFGVLLHLLSHSLFDKLYVNNLFLHIGTVLGLMIAAQHTGELREIPLHDANRRTLDALSTADHAP